LIAQMVCALLYFVGIQSVLIVYDRVMGGTDGALKPSVSLEIVIKLIPARED
jgi:hypothetical protein